MFHWPVWVNILSLFHLLGGLKGRGSIRPEDTWWTSTGVADFFGQSQSPAVRWVIPLKVVTLLKVISAFQSNSHQPSLDMVANICFNKEIIYNCKHIMVILAAF